MPRLSSSPQRPQLPRLPHLPGTVQGAGSLANLSSNGYCGACWAFPMAVDRSNAAAVVPHKPTKRNLRRLMALFLPEAPDVRYRSPDPVFGRGRWAFKAAFRASTGSCWPASGLGAFPRQISPIVGAILLRRWRRGQVPLADPLLERTSEPPAIAKHRLPAPNHGQAVFF